MVFAVVLAGYAVSARSGWAGEPSLRQSLSSAFEGFRGGFPPDNRQAPARGPRMPSRRRWLPATAGLIAVLVALGAAPTTRDLSAGTLLTGSSEIEAMSSNGRYVALTDDSSRSEESIRVRDVQQRMMIHRVLPSTVIAHLAISSNGRWLAAEVRDRFIRVWDLQTRRQRTSAPADPSEP